MLLAIDCGNTHIVAGVYKDRELMGTWRFRSDIHRTEDEYAVLLSELFRARDLSARDIDSIIICSVVPLLEQTLLHLCEKYFRIQAVTVNHTTFTDMPLLVDEPHEVGGDRIVNGVAGYALYGGPLIVVDFGTATTFDCVSAEGAYLGGAIAPGIETANEALFARASRLSTINIYKPLKAIGANTADCLRSGIIWGFAGQVDGIVDKLREELPNARVIATGGLAERISPHCRTIESVDKNLTLTGLKIIHDKISRLP